jgi:hypothetical protein
LTAFEPGDFGPDPGYSHVDGRSNRQEYARFVLYECGTLRTGLRFDFVYGDGPGNDRVGISLLEEDVFAIEAVFYRFISGYVNYGHWGRHTIQPHEKEAFVSEIRCYIEHLKNSTEQQYCPILTMENFGRIYRDIETHRNEVIAFAERFLEWVANSPLKPIVIDGI